MDPRFTDKTTSHKGLFDLPYEIRFRIFEFVVIKHGGATRWIRVQKAGSHKNEDNNICLNIFRTCHQFHAEAYYIFLRNYFEFGVDLGEMPYTSPRIRFQEPYGPPTRSAFSLLSEARHVKLRIDTSMDHRFDFSRERDANGRFVARFHPRMPTSPYWEQLEPDESEAIDCGVHRVVQKLQENRKLRELHLEIYKTRHVLRCMGDVYDPHRVIALAPLRAITGVKKVFVKYYRSAGSAMMDQFVENLAEDMEGPTDRGYSYESSDGLD